MSAEQASAASSPQGKKDTTLKSGVRVQKIQPGKKVGEIRKEWETLFRIPTDAKAYSGTQELSDDATVEEGMTLEFIKKSGEKG